MVCTRVPGSRPDRRRQKVWQAGATFGEVTALMDHLRCEGIQRLVLESTLVTGASDAVDGLAQVQFEVLPGAAPVPVEGDGRHGACHDRDADAGTEAVHGGQDGILAGD
jgi:hypothetical protein